MARFEIKSKDGLSVRFSGKPVYNGSYLKPSSLTFSEVNSPTPIAWEVGDYVDYTRTGMRYYLYSIPQPTKRAKIGSRGDAFSYSGVQFFAATKELEIALFKDLVNSDNNIHFSTSPDVATFENVEGVARRIQSCMDYFFPNRWEIRIADFDAVEDAEIIEKINTAKDFALSNGTCLDALSRIYELWQDIGWIHTNENGKEVIIIGYPNKRISENTTDAFVYGKGNGLTAIKKNQTNKDEFATRLYVYGSERNLPARYYNDKDILNAESVDIRNLMLPLDKWGLTDGKPDARKAYLENAEAVAKYGLIPKTHYFDSEEAGADIYPTISGMTIGAIREALTALGQTDSDYFPSAELYPDASQRVDKVRWCDNPDDHGDVGDVLLNGSPSMFDGETKSVDVSSGTRTANIVENKLMASAEFSYSESRTCKVRFSTAVSGYVNDDGFESVVVKMRLSDSNNANSSMSKVVEYPAVLNGGKWEFTLPSVEYDYGQIPKTIFGAYAFLTIAVTLPSGSKDKSISYVLNTGIQHLDLYLIMEKTFLLRLHEIGFDIDKQASLGKGKVISMKTGACAGRSFVIESCRHKGGIYTQGYWDLTLKRQKDNTLGLMFPNVNAQIAEGDEFVLTDIAMLELYVQAAMLRLLSEGQKLLTRASSIQNLYEPSIDAKVMIEQGRTLREGMFMEISDADVVDNTTEYILIDTLSIHEDESAIPTYKVTLKERRKVTYKGTPSATSTDNTESVEDDVQTEVNIDLSEYAKKAEVEEVSELLSTMWQLEGDTIVATKDVRIKANLIVEQDTSSGGEGQDTPGAGLDEDEVLDIVKGYTYSKSEINKLIDDVNAGDVDLTNYYTKDEVDAKIPSLDGYAKEGYVDDAITALNVGQYAKASELETLQGEVDNIDAVLGLSETAEGYINTWAEVVAFLDAIEQEKDLASILETMNTNIGKNATDIEFLSTRVKAEEGVTETYKTWWADLKKYIKVEGSNVKIDTNLIVTGDTSSGGSGQDTPASGTVTGIKVNGKTYEPTSAGIVTIPDYPTSLEWSAINGKPTALSQFNNDLGLGSLAYLSGITSSMVTDALGYTPLSTGGGTISGGFGALSIKRNNAYASAIRLENTSGVLGYIGFNDDYNARLWDRNQNDIGIILHSGNYSDYALPLSGGKMSGTIVVGDYTAFGQTGGNFYLGTPAYPLLLRSNGTTTINGNTLLHSGNYSSYALPLSGGTRTITSTDNTVLILKTDGWHSTINFKNDHGNSISVGYYSGRGAQLSNGSNYMSVGDDGVPYFNTNTLIHSGNIGSQSVSYATSAGALSSEQLTNIGALDHTLWYDWGNQLGDSFGNYIYGILLESADSNIYTRIAGANYDAYLRVRHYNYGDDSGWKTIAFTDSNVASATKLAGTYHGSADMSSNPYFWLNESGKTKYYLQAYNGNLCLGPTERSFVINPSGNVTLGGSDLAGTSAKLYVDNGMVTIVRANSATQYYGANATFKICTANPSGASVVLGLSAHTSEYCTIQSTKIGTGAMPLSINPSGGNVLIGTTTDSGYKLDVNGDSRINGTITLPVNYQIQWGTTGYMIYGMASRIHVDAPLKVSGNTEINGNLVVSGDVASA